MISVTDLTSYEYCTRKFFLVKVLKLVKPPKEVLIKGSVRHEIYDRINKKEKSIVIQITKKYDLLQTEELFKKNYSEIVREVMRIYRKELEQFNTDLGRFFKETWPLILYESEIRALNAFRFAQKHNLFGEEL